MNSANNSPKNTKEDKFCPFFLDFVKLTGAPPALIWKKPRICYVGDKKKCRAKGGLLIASNHVSFTDPVMLYCVFWYRRMRIWATKELFENPFIAFLFRRMGIIEIDRENFNMTTLHNSIDLLKKGSALLVFPEGHVTQDGETASFKSGVVLMSQLSGAPIQPVYMVRPQKWYQRHVAVVGEPINVRGMCSRFPSVEELQKVTEYIRERELDLEQYYHTHVLGKSHVKEEETPCQS